jgi:large subunit ribosomal protein L25
MITLNAELRDVKVNLKMIRSQGKIPAVFYGAGQVSTPISVDKAKFIKALEEAGESSIVSLHTPKGTLDVLIHDVDVHPVMGDPIHVDFYVVAKDHEIEVGIPLVFVGVAPAEKLGGAVLKVLHELEVRTLPGTIPHDITVDLSVLVDLESHVTVGDLVLPKGVKAVLQPTEIVVAVSAQREEEVAPVAPVDISSIEVEKKGKKEEEDKAAE